MKRRSFEVICASLFIGTGLVSSLFVFEVHGTVRGDMECKQRTVCAISSSDQCTSHSTDCGNRTCGAQCPAATKLICVTKPTQSCNEDGGNVCQGSVQVKSCQAPSGGGNCVCDIPHAGFLDCPDINQCSL